MDTTLIHNAVEIANMPDSMKVYVPDPIAVSTVTANTPPICGMRYEVATIIIPTFVTILVFALGYLIDAWIKHRTSVKETETFRKMIFEWVDLIESTQMSFAMGIGELVKDVKENKRIVIPDVRMAVTMVDKLEVLSAENVMKYLLFRSSKPKDDERAEYAYTIVHKLACLKSLQKSFDSFYKEFREESIKLAKEWISSTAMLHKIIFDGPKSEQEKEIFTRIQEVYFGYLAEMKDVKEHDVRVVHERLIQPLLRSYEDLPFGLKGFERTYEVTDINKNLMRIYSRWEDLSELEAKYFGDIAVKTTDCFYELKTAVEYFKVKTKAIR